MHFKKNIFISILLEFNKSIFEYIPKYFIKRIEINYIFRSKESIKELQLVQQESNWHILKVCNPSAIFHKLLKTITCSPLYDTHYTHF